MVSAHYQKFIKVMGDGAVFLNEMLSKYTSFRLGGPADLFYRAKTTQDLLKAIITANRLQIPFFVLGGGTNVLIGDKGFHGIVIKNDTSRIQLAGIRGSKKPGSKKEQIVFLEVDSGVSTNRLVRYSLDQGYAGLEVFLGQPGTVGGAMWINAHNMARGKFFGDCLYRAKLVTNEGVIKEVDRDYFKFGYDDSILQRTKEVVLSATLMLSVADKEKLWEAGAKTLEYRRLTQPSGIYSAGCTFRNISKSDALRIPTPDYVQSAGYLIDSVGLKGQQEGGASFSREHANFIVHHGKATASDVKKLITLAKQQVQKKYNVTLQEEIVLIGDFT